MGEVAWLDERQARAWRALQLMQMRLTAELAHQLTEDSRLSYSDYVVLVALTDQADGSMRAFELAGTLGWEQSRLSHHLHRMRERGLVDKVRCDSDHRGSVVVVTDRGRQELEAAAPGHVAAVRRLFVDRLTQGQLDVIADVGEAVLAALDNRS